MDPSIKELVSWWNAQPETFRAAWRERSPDVPFLKAVRADYARRAV